MTPPRTWPAPAALSALAGTLLLLSSSALLPAEEVAESRWQWTVDAVVDTVAVGDVTLSPDGTSVVFTRSRWRTGEAGPGPAHANLWRVPAAGGEPQRLTWADARDSKPRYSPDGSTIAFLSRRGDESDVARDLVPVVGKVGEVAWSPDGKTVAWLGGVDGSDPYQGSLFTVPVTGGSPRNLTGDREETARSLAWPADGRIALGRTAATSPLSR